MKKLSLILIVAAFGLIGCTTPEESEQPISLSEVPESALKAAQTAVEGIVISGARIETEEGQPVYEFDGQAHGKAYSIEVTPDGKVLEVEEED